MLVQREHRIIAWYLDTVILVTSEFKSLGLEICSLSALYKLVATMTDRVLIVAVGTMLMSLAAGLGYSALN